MLKSMPEALMGLVGFMRQVINGIIFEIFIQSINTAHKRKINSLILFILNCKELKQIRHRGIMLSLEIYFKFIKMIKKFIPNFGLIRPLEFENMLNKELGNDFKFKKDNAHRNQYNQWVAQTLATVVWKRKMDKNETNKDYL